MLNAMYRKHLTKLPSTSGFVSDGYQRAVAAIECEVRSQVEQKYSDRWNASGLIRRWFLLRIINREVAADVAIRLERISPDSMF